jgi:hypothetical protein
MNNGVTLVYIFSCNLCNSATKGLEDDTCELVKMYLSKSARDKGLGKNITAKCIDEAKQQD